MARAKRDDELETVDDSVKNAPKDENVSNEPHNVVAEPVGAVDSTAHPVTTLKETPGLPEDVSGEHREDRDLGDVQARRDEVAAKIAEHESVITNPDYQDVVHAPRREKAHAALVDLRAELNRLTGHLRGADEPGLERAKELYEDRLKAEEELHRDDRYTPR